MYVGKDERDVGKIMELEEDFYFIIYYFYVDNFYLSLYFFMFLKVRGILVDGIVIRRKGYLYD